MENRLFDRLVLAAIGLLQGLTYLLVPFFVSDKLWVNGFLIGTLVFVAIAGFVFQFLWNGKPAWFQVIGATGTGLVFSIITVWALVTLSPSDPYSLLQAHFAAITLTVLLGVYIVIAHLESWQDAGTIRYPYRDLFHRSWNNLIIVGVAYLVALVFWGIIAGFVGLFLLLNIKLAGQILFSKEFISLFFPIVFGFGIAIGKENDSFIYESRKLLLAIFSFVTPFFALFILMYAAGLFFTGFQSLLEMKDAAFLLLLLLLVGVLLVNAIFQDGETGREHPVWIRWSMYVVILVLPVIAFATVYVVWTAYKTSGLSVMRVYQMIFLPVLLFFSLGYVVAVLGGRQRITGLLRKVNVTASGLFVLLIILIHSPVLDPYSATANFYFNKLVSGKIKPADVDFGRLIEQTGKPGRDRVRQLLKRKDYPAWTEVHARVRAVLRNEVVYRGKRYQDVFRRENFIVYGQSKALPEAVLLALKNNVPRFAFQDCHKTRNCALIAYNIDSDPELEYIVAGDSWMSLIVLDYTPTGWKRIGTYTSPDSAEINRRVPDAARNNRIRLVRPLHSDLEIGGVRYRMH